MLKKSIALLLITILLLSALSFSSYCNDVEQKNDCATTAETLEESSDCEKISSVDLASEADEIRFLNGNIRSRTTVIMSVGDINEDSLLNFKDLSMLKTIIAGSNTEEYKRRLADVLNDNLINMKDISQLKAVLAGAEPIESVEITIETPDDDTYTVTFVDYDGTVLKEETVAEGQNATPPANPAKSGADFIGWSHGYIGVNDNSTVKAIYSDDSNVLYYVGEDGNAGDTITVTLKIGGNISICRYFLSLKYDNSALRLTNYDSEISLYMPTVNPEKDDNDQIIGDAAGNINLSWAASSNKTRKADIIELEFEVLDDSKPTEIYTVVNAIMALNGSAQVNVDYSAVSVVINAQ